MKLYIDDFFSKYQKLEKEEKSKITFFVTLHNPQNEIPPQFFFFFLFVKKKKKKNY